MNHPRNSATIREKSRRRLLRRIEDAKANVKRTPGELELVKRLQRLQGSYDTKFPEPVKPAEPAPTVPAPKVKKPRAKKA